MDVEEVVAFIVGGVVLAWAFRSAAFAFSGGDSSGLHEVAPPAEEQSLPSADDLEARYQRRHRFHQMALYLAGLGVTGAIVAMLVGSALA
jgi:hypothetical protein